MKKIFVTGGAGFIGSAIVNHLKKSQHELMMYDDLSFRNRQFVNVENSRKVMMNSIRDHTEQS